MGKRLIISDANFFNNAIHIAKAVNNTPSTLIIYVDVNNNEISDDFDWDNHKQEIYIREDGTIPSFNLPDDTKSLYFFICGPSSESNWLSEIDLSYLSTYPLNSFYGMLANCTNLKRIILGGTFNHLSTSNCVNYFVWRCNSLEEIIIRDDFKAPNLYDIKLMFCESGVQRISGLKYLINSYITDMSTTFYSCIRLIDLDLTDCDTSNVTTFHRMFEYCYWLSNIIGINDLDTHNVTTFYQMFMYCISLKKLSIENWNIKTNAITTGMFLNAIITELNANCFTALYGDISNMFNMNEWNTIHLDNLNDVSAVTNYDNLFSNIVSDSPKITIANVSNTDVKTMLKTALNSKTVGGSSDWQEAVVDGILCLVPNV